MRASQLVSMGICALAATACDIVQPAQPGAIRIVSSTTGVDPDENGYRASVDLTGDITVPTNGSVVIDGIEPGARSIRLVGVAANCVIQSGPTRSVTVQSSQTVDVAFDVGCAANRGRIQVWPQTGGADGDDEYLVSVDGAAPVAVGVSGIIIDNIPVGARTLTLSGVAANCAVQSPNITVNVAFNQTTLARHIVSCVARTGGLAVQVTTTGDDIDATGYEAYVADHGGTSIGTNGSATIAAVREGNRLVELRSIAPNCTVAGPNPRAVTVTFGQITEVAFAVSCVAFGSARVTVNTTGVDPDLGYIVRVTGAAFDRTVDASGNGAITISGMGNGDHVVTLEDVAVNCNVSAGSPNPNTVTISSGVTAQVTFAVACSTAPEIAFVRRWTSSEEIFAAKLNAVSMVQLTANSAEEHDPAYSRDGTRIVFRSTRDGNPEIYAMNADGSGVVRLTNHPASDLNPEWSPDGTRIAFRSGRDGNDEIYVMNANGSSVTRLTNHAAFDGKPTWSADGQKIAFMSSRSGQSQIWVMNADGSNPVRLTNSSAFDGLPAWSPDGTRIAFVREVSCSYYYYSCHNIVVMNADGTALTRLESSAHETEPAWSPDGQWIAFESSLCDYYSCTAAILSAVRANGSRRTSLISGNFYNPAWRP